MRRFVVLLVLASLGCDGGPTTLIVQVRTELLPGREMQAVRVTVEPAGGGAPIERITDATSATSWGAGVRVAEIEAVPSGRTRLRVSALDASGAVLVERPVRADLSGGIKVVTVLLTRDCLGVVCPDPGGDPAATACFAGRCVPEDCTEETADGCGPRGCATDADCPASSACATARCLPSGRCFAEPDPARCGAGEVCHPDEGCIPEACRGTCELLLVQCGCGDGEGCYTTTGSDRVCQPAGTLAEGEPCVRDFDCQPGHACLGNAGELPYACRRFCAGPSDCGPPRACADIGIAGLRVCLGVGCDPVTGDGCPAGETCIHALPGPGGEALTECRPLGAAGPGAGCSEATDCQAALLCEGHGAEPTTCRGYCRTHADCGAEGVCLELPRIAGSGLGVCDAGCDLLSGAGCAAGVCGVQGTNDVDGQPAGVRVCRPAGTTPIGGACSSDASCVGGALCGGTPAQCTALCDVDAPTCATGTCMPITPTTVLGARTIGLCI